MIALFFLGADICDNMVTGMWYIKKTKKTNKKKTQPVNYKIQQRLLIMIMINRAN